MPSRFACKVTYLGQTGLRLDNGNTTILVDPYLSNSVQDLDSKDLVRQVPIKFRPSELTDVSWILITHDHLDHCDPHTLPLISRASPHRALSAFESQKAAYQVGYS